jgi:hypothetical protein
VDLRGVAQYERPAGGPEESRQAREETHRAEEETSRAFERSISARARILSAPAAGVPADPDDLRARETYCEQAQIAARQGLRFVEVSKASGWRPAPPRVKKESIEVMKLALRVLNALTEKTAPAAADLEGLLSFAPDLTKLPPDELACEVIQRAMKRQVHMQRALNTGSY